MAVMRSSRLVAYALLLLTASTGEAKARAEMSGSLVRSVPVLPSPGERSVSAPPLSMSDYSRLGTGRLTTLARAQVLGFVTGMTFPQRPALDEQGRLRLLVRQSVGGLPPVGYSASSLSQTVSEVRVRAGELPSLLADPTIVRIDGVHRLRPLLDLSRTVSGAAWVSDKLNLRGRGVMVAILDTGVDFRHADLRDQSGKTRIAYLLSRSEPRDARHPEIPDYDGMQVHTAKDLDELLDLEAKGMQPPVPIRELDINGHGTHLAGIVGSTGLAKSGSFASGRYVGMAPESSLCIAKITRDEVSFDDPDILRGVRFCLDRAEENHQPIVVNLSLGADGGRHDGSSLLELALDELLANRPGRVLVAAVGNSGDEDLHASSALLQGSQSVTLHVSHQDVPVEQSSVSLELYYHASAPPEVGGAAELTFLLFSPGGRRFEVPMGQALRASFDDEGEAVIDAADVAATGMRGVVITLGNQPGKGPPKAGDWRLELRGKTLRYDLWRVAKSDDLNLQLRGHLDLDGYVGIPASASSAISVGSLRSRVSWKRADGKDASFDREIGRVSTFSSGGPLSSGGFAPDVLAPGEFILSALSSSSLQSDPRSSYSLPRDPGLLIADDGLHGVMRGTSQAAPHVAGAVALMLELFPKLTTTEVRELLRTTSRLPLGQGYGPRRGFGQLDLQALFDRLGGGMLLALSPPWSDVGVNRDIAAPNAETITITVTPRDALGRPLGRGLPVSITSDRGAWIGEVRDEGHGRYERTLLAQGPRGSQATIEVRVGGVLLDQQPVVYFVGDRSEIGQPFVISACAMSTMRGRSASPWMLVMLVALPLLLRHRRGGVGRLSLRLLLLLAAGCSESTTEPLTGPASSRDKGGDFYWAVRDALLHPSLVIHLGTQQAELFEGQTVVAQSSICSGRVSRKTPKGSFAVLEKVPQHISGRYGDYVTDMGEVVLANVDSHDQPPPPGTTFRGTPMPYFMRIVGGIGLHAGPLPGHPDSHGCVRFPRLFAQRLFETVPLGSKVVVTD